MLKKLTKLTLMTVLLLFSVSSSWAATKDEKAFFKGIRPMGMGGAFVAVADDENAFFYNPAGITQISGKMMQFFSFDMSVNTETYEFAKFYSDNRDDLKNFDKLNPHEQAKLLNKINKNILGARPKINMGAPNFVFISGHTPASPGRFGFGAGLFSFADADFRFNRSIVVPSFTYKGQASVIASVPAAYRIDSFPGINIPGSLSLGVNIKYVYRILSQARDLSVDEFENFKVPVQDGGGFGADFGLIYHPDRKWNIGLQLADAFTTRIDYCKYVDDKNPAHSKDSFTGEIRPSLSIGAAYFPEKFYYWPGKYIETGDNVIIAADLTDIAGEDEKLSDSFWKKVHFGAEVKLLNIFSLRAGINSGYPSAGAGIETKIVCLDYAFYGQEEGIYAGQDPSWSHRIRFAVKIGGARAAKAAEEKSGEINKEEKPRESSFENINGENGETADKKESADDVKPADIPKDAKDIISKKAEITEEN